MNLIIESCQFFNYDPFPSNTNPISYRLRCPRGWYATVRFRISIYTVQESSLDFHYSHSLPFTVDITIKSSPCNTRFFLFFYNVCMGHHYTRCVAQHSRDLFINKPCCRSTGISLRRNPKPYRQYLTFGQVYRLIEFLYLQISDLTSVYYAVERLFAN